MKTQLLGLAASLALCAPALAAGPDFADRQDYAFAERGFVATRADPKILGAGGQLVWDLTAYDFLKAPAPASVNPSLWRQSQLLAKHGLFEVTKGVWQVRGFDISNATFIAGKTGWIVIDPLTSTEVAKAALDLANEKLGARPVAALIYTHSHGDHFGGARGMVAQADVDAGKVQVIAPAGFLEHAVSENVIAGPAMNRRATYQFGTFLPKGPLRPGQLRHRHGGQPRDHDAHSAHSGDRQDRPGTGGRWGAPAVPAHAGHRGAGGDEHLPARPEAAGPGRERQRHHAQCADAARGAGARRQGLGGLPDASPSGCTATAATS